MKLAQWLLAIPMLVAASAMGAQATVGRYAGLSSVDGEPPFKTYLEIQRSGVEISGHLEIPGGTFTIQDAQAEGDRIRGKLVGDGKSADFSLLVTPETARGEFTLEGQHGTIDLARTDLTAEQALGAAPERQDLTAAEWNEDLEELVRIITSEHVAPFHHVSEEKFRAEAERARRLIPDLSGPEVAVEFRRLAAMIGDGHTGSRLFTNQPRYPISMVWLEDGLRIVEMTAANRNLLGATVLAVDGVPAKDALEAMRPFTPADENEGVFRDHAPILPQVVEEADWTRPKPDAPLWEQRPGEQFWTLYWGDAETLYVNFRGYDDLARNADRFFGELDRLRPARLIIDLRGNGGGDYEKGRRLLIEPLAQRPWINSRGRLFVMIGRQTFSAAMVNAVDFGDRTEAVLVGEPIGEKPNSYQEVRQFTLPNSGLTVGVSTKRYEFMPGDPANEIRPDIVAPPRWEDWLSPRDNAVERVLQLHPDSAEGPPAKAEAR